MYHFLLPGVQSGAMAHIFGHTLFCTTVCTDQTFTDGLACAVAVGANLEARLKQAHSPGLTVNALRAEQLR